MQLYLVRHGQSNGNVHFVPGVPRPKTDPLTELGRQQAKQAAAYLGNQAKRPAKIVSSPYTRTLDTAQYIQAVLGVQLEVDERLAEYDIGAWEGMHSEEVARNFSALPVHERYLFRPPGGESWLDEAERMHAAIAALKDAGVGRAVLVSHLSPIRAIVHYLLKHDPEQWATVLTHHEPGSVTIMQETDGGWELTTA